MFFFIILFAAAGLLNALTPPPVLPPNSAEIMPYGSTAENVRITYNVNEPLRVDVYKSSEGRNLLVDSRYVESAGTYDSIFPALQGAHDAAYAFHNGDVYVVEMWRNKGNYAELVYQQMFKPSRVAVPFAANGGQ